ncbi:MAG: hypothetical protein WBX26_10745 [Candidatus Cybelea sp.]
MSRNTWYVVGGVAVAALIFQLFLHYQYEHLAGGRVMRIDRLTGSSCFMPCVATSATATPAPTDLKPLAQRVVETAGYQEQRAINFVKVLQAAQTIQSEAGEDFTWSAQPADSFDQCVLIALKGGDLTPITGQSPCDSPSRSDSVYTTVATGINSPWNLALDRASNLFVSNFNNGTVTEYAPPYSGAPSRIIHPGRFVTDVAIDEQDNLFVLGDNVSELAPPYNKSSRIIVPAVFPSNLVVGNGYLFVSAVISRTDQVYVYAAPYSGAAVATIPIGKPTVDKLYLDPKGDLFVATSEVGQWRSFLSFDIKNARVLEYKPPYSGEPVAVINRGTDQTVALGFDSQADLFVAGDQSNTVAEYAPPYTGKPLAIISNGKREAHHLTALAVDDSGSLFLADYSDNYVTEYAPPYEEPEAKITNGLSGPGYLLTDSNAHLFVANQYARRPSGAASTGTVTVYAIEQTPTPQATIAPALEAAQMKFNNQLVCFCNHAGSGWRWEVHVDSDQVFYVNDNADLIKKYGLTRSNH